MTDRNDNPTGDARTVLPGQPVTYHQPAVASDLAAIKPDEGWYSIMESWQPLGPSLAVMAGGLCIGTPIPSEPPDPSKIVGVCDPSASQPEFEYPPIPPAGFYWAKTSGDCETWTPVEVTEHRGKRRVGCIDWEGGCDVTEWGPRIDPPGAGVALDESTGKCTGCAVPIHRGNAINHVGDKPWHTQCLVRSLTGHVEALQKRYDERKAQRLTYVEAQKLKGALGAALLGPTHHAFDLDIPARKVTRDERLALEAVLDRVTVQPAECTHDAWKWPMQRCPACGAEGRARRNQ